VADLEFGLPLYTFCWFNLFLSFVDYDRSIADPWTWIRIFCEIWVGKLVVIDDGIAVVLVPDLDPELVTLNEALYWLAIAPQAVSNPTIPNPIIRRRRASETPSID
jgi:hypothetical protein